MADLVVGCLVYLNDKVFDRRIDMCRESFTSFRTFGPQKATNDIDIIFINNGDDPRVAEELKEHVTVDYTLLNLKQNFFDISVHMCSYWRALEQGARYFAYTYDDFIFYDDTWVDSAIKFMDKFPDVSCIRLPKYMLGDPFYDTTHTSKHDNPDAVRHEDGAGGNVLQMIRLEAKDFTPHEFCFTNWRPNSRPMMWRTEAFGSIVKRFAKLPVMQTFEMLLYAWADSNPEKYVSGFVNRGVCHTFPVDTSERTQAKNHYRDVVIDLKELLAAYEASK